MEALRPTLGARLGDRYDLAGKIGSGGTATVFLATDTKHNRQVAIKVLRPDVADALGSERFLREIETLSVLNHPHILPLYDSGEAGGLLYYIMPYVEGESLRQRLTREGALPVEEAVRIARECADGLSYAHEHGILHRDVKPANIMLWGEHAVLSDFGIARAIDVSGSEHLTKTGFAVGTPEYMSPEQAGGSEHLDGRSDLYCLGCVLYEMLSGGPPFTGATSQAIVARHLSESPPSIRVVRPTVPVGLVRVVEKALEKVPADRFSSAAEMSDVLSRPFVEQEEAGRKPRAGLVVAGLVALVALALLGGAWKLLSGGGEDLDPDHFVVFPLAVTGGEPTDKELGRNVALALSWALNTTEGFRAIEGWQLLEAPAQGSADLVPMAVAREIARSEGAGHVIDGSILVGDSVRMMLAVRRVGARTTAQRVTVVDSAGDPWALGLQGALDIVRALVGSDAPLDYSVLEGRSPPALEAFLKAERAYHEADFSGALQQYRTAFDADSDFTLVALRAAQAAGWTHDSLGPDMTAALGDAGRLPPRYTHFARGLKAYRDANADSAVVELRQVIALEPRSPEAWMALGEVYTHLLPRGPPPDSMAEVAFRRVERLDPGFKPLLYHTIQTALRSGDVQRARTLLPQLRAAKADSLLYESSELLVRCASQGPSAIDWKAEVSEDVAAVNDAAQWFTRGGLPYPECSEASWRALLDYGPSLAWHFGGLLGLQSVLLGQRRYADFRALLDADSAVEWHVRGELYISAAVAGAPVAERAGSWADSLRAIAAREEALSAERLWFLGIWEAFTGHPYEAERIARRVTAEPAMTDATAEEARLRELIAASLTARAALAQGDSTRAEELLSALTPTGPPRRLLWLPYESLGGEQILLAKLLLARGASLEALRVAKRLDAPAAVPYTMYLPQSLEIREQAARSLGYTQLADEMRQRRERLLDIQS